MMLIALHFGDDAIESLLIETHNLEVSDGIRTVAPFWDISDSHTFEYLTGSLAKSLRLGVTMMDEISLLTTEVTEELRDLGFDVDVFVLESVANKSKGRDNIHTSDVLQHPPFESDV
jgi:hypothetical protein